MPGLTRRALLQRAAVLTPVALWPTLLAGCSDDNQGTGSGGSGTLDVLVGFGTGNAPDQVKVQEELARAFKSGGGSQISFRRIPDGEAAQRQLGVLIAAGTPPDIILPTGVYGISLYLDKNVWLDLNPLLAANDVDLGLFVPAAVDAARAPNYYGPDSDVIVGLPDGVFTHTIAYNKDLFAAAGVDEPPHEWNTPDWDYDALLTVTKALTLDSSGRSAAESGFDADDIVQFGLGHWDTGLMALGYGAQRYDPESRQLLLDSPENIEGTQFGRLDEVVDKVDDVLTPGGALVIVEWDWQRFDSSTAQWCFGRLAPVPVGSEPGWLHVHQAAWIGSGLPWDNYLHAWATEHGLHTAEQMLRELDARFDRVSCSLGSYFFAELADTTEADEQQAIDSKQIAANGIRYVGRSRRGDPGSRRALR